MAETFNKENAKNPVSNGRRLPTKRAMDDVDLDRMTKRRRKAFLFDKRQQRGVVANATDEDGLGQSSTENQAPSGYASAAGILFSSTGTESNGQNNKQATSAGSLGQQAEQSKEREEEKKESDAISISLQDIIMNQPELARANESTVVASRHNDTVGRRDSFDIDGLVVDGGIHNYANTDLSSYASSDIYVSKLQVMANRVGKKKLSGRLADGSRLSQLRWGGWQRNSGKISGHQRWTTVHRIFYATTRSVGRLA